MIEVPKGFVDALEALAERSGLKSQGGLRTLAEQVRRLSLVYTKERDLLEVEANASASLSPRLRFFLPRDLPKIAGPLGELHAAGALPPGRRWRVLDVGAGLGATSLGASLFAANRCDLASLDVLAVDSFGESLRLMKKVAELAKPPNFVPLRVEFQVADMADLARTLDGKRFDLILVGFALNEVAHHGGPSAATEVVSMLGQHLEPAGSIIILEPALRDTARALHSVRDELLKNEDPLGVFAPCLHQDRCPMLLTERDWCHEEVPIPLPDALVPLAKAAGLRFERLTYAYLTLRHDSRSLAELCAPLGGTPYRVTSRPLPSKGKLEIFGCAGPKSTRIVRLKRHRASGNQALDRAKRGDLIGVEGGQLDAERLRILPDTKVRLLPT